MTTLTAPFPYYGGKRRFAEVIWERLGDPEVYAEPFFGSGAVLLARPHKPRCEVVSDTNGFIPNAYRALRADPEAVAAHADFPTYHHDLHARHVWLVDWGRKHKQRLMDDPEYYDAKAAGWWIWGMSNWIGGGFCAGAEDDQGATGDQRPLIGDGYGKGVQVAVKADISEKRPIMGRRKGVQAGIGSGGSEVTDGRPSAHARPGGGRGVQVQRESLVDEKRPDVKQACGVAAKTEVQESIPSATTRHGLQVRRTSLPRDAVIGTGERLLPWFQSLSDRLAKVLVLNRPWESCVTPAALLDNNSEPDRVTAVFLDPPYLTADRSTGLYPSDTTGDSDDLAVASWRWAVEKGDKYRIAYACHDGDFDIPDGWTKETMTFGGIHDPERQKRMDCVIFSPACQESPQGDLFGDG